MTSIVALDIETTGLDPTSDCIIEIGAIRFNGNRTEAEFNTLVNPKRHIPEFITGLTGIDDAMVRNAPGIQDVLNDLEAFMGDSPILGHNIKFDLSFFEKFMLFKLNERIDTYEIAAVLLPAAPRYNLGALGRQLAIPLSATHRALDDARVTAAVFNKLNSLAHDLPVSILTEIVHFTETLDWDGEWTFRHVLRARSSEKKKVTAQPTLDSTSSFFKKEGKREYRKIPPLQNVEEPLPIDTEEATSILEYGGHFSQYFDGYEHRPEQVEMLRAVSKALSRGEHLLVEAGTGVGKSLAYLVPAALFSIQNNTRVLISTNTINLQDQLIKKDIPDLCAAMQLDLRSAILKGRSNYLCPRRLDLMRRRLPVNTDELRVMAKVLVWLQDNHSGDRSDINLTGPVEREIWQRISAEDDTCTNETCLDRQGGVCPFFQARQAALNAHILVVNHALLLTDVAVGNRILPEYDHVIIDEGHHLETATTNALSFRLTQWELDRMIREVGSTTSGVLGQIISVTRDVIRPSDFALLGQMVERATDLAWRLQEQSRIFFDALSEFLASQRDDQPLGTYVVQERVLPSTRTQPNWEGVEAAWSAAGETLNLLNKLIADLQKGTADLYADGVEALEDVIGNIGNLYRRFLEAENMVNSLIFEPSNDVVYWIEINPNNNRLALNAAPVRIGPLVEKNLWHEKRSVIITSATLTTHGRFDYIRDILSADEADELAVGSPFDYESSAMLYIANDIDEPHTSNYQRQMDQTLINLCLKSGGRALVLFTSYAQLKRTARSITAPLARDDIIVYEQGDGASANSLLESFKSTDRAVLLGTRSFWEGVDVPGEALSVLVITKLPFAVPTDPIVAARSETYEDPFSQYQLPEAILRFRQGFGRLIRSQSDKGVVVVLDKRLLTKSYGRYFVESLPECSRRIGPLIELPQLTAKWLGL